MVGEEEGIFDGEEIEGDTAVEVEAGSALVLLGFAVDFLLLVLGFFADEVGSGVCWG